MKSINIIIIGFILSTALFSCKKKAGEDPEPDASTQEMLIEALQGTWSPLEVRKENAVISDFSDFSITINGKNYVTENGAPVWPSSGSFDFENIETENEFIRQDGRLFTASADNNNLTIVIIYQEETARGEYGTYEFTLSK